MSESSDKAHTGEATPLVGKTVMVMGDACGADYYAMALEDAGAKVLPGKATKCNIEGPPDVNLSDIDGMEPKPDAIVVFHPCIKCTTSPIEEEPVMKLAESVRPVPLLVLDTLPEPAIAAGDREKMKKAGITYHRSGDFSPQDAVSLVEKLTAPPQVTVEYHQFISGLKAIADDEHESAKRRSGAKTLLNLNHMGDGERRIGHMLQTGMNAKVRHGKIILNGAEKFAVDKAVDAIMQEKANQKAIREAMDTDDNSKAADITRREWGGRISRWMGWGMLLTVAGKGGLDHFMDKTTAEVRKKVQLPQMVKYIQDHPPPANEPEKSAYYEELDKHMSKGLVGTVRDQFPWLSIMSASGAAALIHFGGRSREAAVEARKDHHKACARYAADVAGDVIEKLALTELHSRRP